jgi:hypothetical protein
MALQTNYTLKGQILLFTEIMELIVSNIKSLIKDDFGAIESIARNNSSV